jgi:MFS family permease
VRSPYRLLVLALACQASISIVQWGLGVIAPDLQSRYGLSAAGLGALVNATALGNAVALIAAGVVVDRSGPRRPLLFAGSACGLLLVIGALLKNPVGLGVALFASGVAGAVVAVGVEIL